MGRDWLGRHIGRCQPYLKGVYLTLSLAVYFAVLFRTAWLSDDAYITFRTVENFIHGYGLTWNTLERVQVYTHPLWMFLVSLCYFFSREIFYTAIFLSVGISLIATLVLAVKIAPSPRNVLLGFALLVNSKAFIDYSTSGLENPLSHLILACFFFFFLKREVDLTTLLVLSFTAALATLNRMDTILLFIPALTHTWWKIRGARALGAVAVGFTPFLVWELFSLFYYGFLFPNTAYAKLNTGIPRIELAVQGWHYLLNSARLDPLTLLTVIAGIVLVAIRLDSRQISAGLGVILYLFYVVVIGGDFMSGRFLSAPFFLTVVLLCHSNPFKGLRIWGAICCAIFLVGLNSAYPPLLSGAGYGSEREEMADANGITDERGYYYQNAGLLTALRAPPGSQFPDDGWAKRGRATRSDTFMVVFLSNLGFSGFFSGPNVHIIDVFALADPLLARLPAKKDPNWRIGHFSRLLPEGYVETHFQGQNRVKDTDLAVYFDKLQIIVRGDLADRDRWAEIWRMNIGQYDDLIDREAYRNPSPLAIRLSDASHMSGRPDVHVSLGKEYIKLGYTKKGIASLEEAHRLNDSNFINVILEADFPRQAWKLHLESNLETAGDRSQNPPLNRDEIDRHSIWIYAAFKQGAEYLKQGDTSRANMQWEEGLEHCRRVLAIQSDATILQVCGKGLLAIGLFDEAANLYRRSIALSQDPSERYTTYMDLARLYRAKGNLAEASEAEEEAKKIKNQGGETP